MQEKNYYTIIYLFSNNKLIDSLYKIHSNRIYDIPESDVLYNYLMIILEGSHDIIMER